MFMKTLIQINLCFTKYQVFGEIMKGAYFYGLIFLVLFSFLFFKLNKNTEKKFRLLTLTFQNILIFGFFYFY